MWIARDHDGSLWLYKEKPIRKGLCFVPPAESVNERAIPLDNKGLYPEVTWDNSPKYLTII
jgi:hypothetical protein